MATPVLAAVASWEPLTMASGEVLSQVRRLIVNELVDCLMTDTLARTIYRQPSGYLLRRPAHLQMANDVFPGLRVLQSRPFMRFLVAFLGPFLGLVSQIVSLVDWRRVVLQFTAYGRMVTA